MTKNAAKLLYTIAGLAVLAAVAFAAFTGGHAIGMDTLLGPLTLGWKGYVGDHVAYAVLVATAAAALLGGITVSLIADGDASAGARAIGVEAVPAPAPVERANYWPAVGALSFALVALGLALGPILFVMGGIGIAIVLVEWTVRAWSERATGDRELNRHLRDTLMIPVEYPALGVLVVAGVALAMWKIMMALPSVGAIVVFAAVPALILAFGALLVLKPQVSQSVIAGLIVIGVVALIVGGVIAAVVGERDHGSHHEGLRAPTTVIKAGR